MQGTSKEPPSEKQALFESDFRRFRIHRITESSNHRIIESSNSFSGFKTVRSAPWHNRAINIVFRSLKDLLTNVMCLSSSDKLLATCHRSSIRRAQMNEKNGTLSRVSNRETLYEPLWTSMNLYESLWTTHHKVRGLNHLAMNFIKNPP